MNTSKTTLIDQLRSAFTKVSHSHLWEKLNEASILDVNDTYPPTHVDYISPVRRCQTCGVVEEYVGPEVCGGDTAKWVAVHHGKSL